MGLADILSNPGILGLAMAGLSRDPDAPYRTFGVMQGANDMARQAQMDEEKKLQRADTLKALEAMYGNQQGQENALVNALSRFQGAQAMPEKTIAAPPLGGAPEAMPQLEENKERIAETKAALSEIKQVAHPAEAAFRISDYPNANPEILAAGMAKQYNLKLEAAKWLMQEAREEKKAKQLHANKLEEIAAGGEQNRLTEITKGAIKAENQETVPMIVNGKQVNVPVGQALNAELRKQMMEDSKMRHEENVALRKELAERAMGLRERIPAGQAKELSDKLSAIDRYKNLTEKFEDKFAGSKILGPTMSQVYERVGTNKPRVNWWKEFRWLDNQLRHEIFGASLTGNEQKAWDLTTISENADPEIIKKQLQDRLNYAQNAFGRNLDSFTSAGYNVEGFRKPGVMQNKMQQLGQPQQDVKQQQTPQPNVGGKPKTWEELKGKYKGQ